MTIEHLQFQRLMNAVSHLHERNTKLKALRSEYFEALEQNDRRRQQAIVQEARSTGLELFDELPLEQIDELNVALQLGDRVEQVAQLRELVDQSRKLTTDLAELDAYAEKAETNQNILNALHNELSLLHSQLAPTTDEADLSSDARPSMAEISRRLQAQLVAMQQERDKLTQQRVTIQTEVTRAQTELELLQAFNALEQLYILSPRNYDHMAQSLIDKADRTLQNNPHLQRENQLEQQLQAAREALRIWQTLKNKFIPLVEDLETIAQGLQHQTPLATPQFRLVEEINEELGFYANQQLPPVITRLITQVVRLQPPPKAAPRARNDSPDLLQKHVSTWWHEWWNLQMSGQPSTGKKRSFLERIVGEIDQLFDANLVPREQPITQEIVIAWKQRCERGIELAMLLQEIHSELGALDVQQLLQQSYAVDAHYTVNEETVSTHHRANNKLSQVEIWLNWLDAATDQMYSLESISTPETLSLFAQEWSGLIQKLFLIYNQLDPTPISMRRRRKTQQVREKMLQQKCELGQKTLELFSTKPTVARPPQATAVRGY